MKYQRYAVLVLLLCLIGWIGIPVKADLGNTIAFEGIDSIATNVIVQISNNVKSYTKDKIGNYINGVIYASLKAKLPPSVKVTRYSAASSEKFDAVLTCEIFVDMRPDGLYYGDIILKLARLVSISSTGKLIVGALYGSRKIFAGEGDLEDSLRIDAEHLVQNFIIDFSEARVGTAAERAPMQVGGFVEFGSYLGARILWRVMEINGGKPLLWSEYILCAKCFDAAESGTADKGSNDVAKYGSNVWSRSNLREWLNSTGMVNWSTQPPTSTAIWEKNNYENEDGFLKDFSALERGLLAKTDRRIADSNGNYKETTQDLIFLASEEEVRDGGRWGLNAVSRKKTPTMQAANQDRTGWLQAGSNWWYYLETPYASVASSDVGGGVSYGGDIYWGFTSSSGLGVAPALHLSSINAISGNGTRENPWRVLS